MSCPWLHWLGTVSIKLGGGVLCHHSPGWISLAFRQDPYIQMVTSLYICGRTFYDPQHHCFHPHHHLFLSSFTSSWYLLLFKLNHLWATSLAHFHKTIHHVCTSRLQPDPVVPIILETRCGMWWKMRQWRFQVETRCHLETIGVPLLETVFKTWFGSV